MCKKTFFYLFGLASFLVIIQDEVATVLEAAWLLLIYVIYVSLVVYLYFTGREVEPDHHHADPNAVSDSIEREALLIEMAPISSKENDRQTPAAAAVGSPGRSPPSLCHRLFFYFETVVFFNRPMVGFLIPPLRPELTVVRNPLYECLGVCGAVAIDCSIVRCGCKKSDRVHDVTLTRIGVIFGISVCMVGVLVKLLMAMVESIVSHLRLDSTTIAATLMAMGSEVILCGAWAGISPSVRPSST
jgi:Ca2+/Na+ antiporter